MAAKGTAPAYRPPQLATLANSVPTASGWIHEYKYDGYRLLIATGTRGATAWTRNGKDWSDKFKPLVDAAQSLPSGCLIDGEAVALGRDGKPSFQLLQSGLKDGTADLAFYAFDLIVDSGTVITRLPTLERKARLAALLKGIKAPIIFGDHVEGKGEALLDAICKDGGEGIISKRADAPYSSLRTRDWLKVKCTKRQEFVVVGWRDSDKARGFRSLLLATRDGNSLTFAGKVGTGFTMSLIDELLRRMRPLEIDKPALDIPRGETRGAHFIKPKLVAEIAFTEFTRDGTLRHPSFLGLREDKPAAAVKRETAGPLTVAELGIRISNPDRVIFPEDGITKGELAEYYAAIAPLVMTDAANRPITLIRCPQGRAKNCFFQKHDSGTFGAWVKQVPIKEKDGSVEDYLWFDDIRGLLSCVQMGTIEFHGWGSRASKVEFPDRLVFDLDPDVGLDFERVKEAALRLRTLLGDLGLETYPMLTGGKGIHVVAPIDPRAGWSKVTSFAERFARAIAEAEPEIFTANIRKAQRKGRIFLDWLRNQRGATAVLPYSARARLGAPVAAPINWDELKDFDGANAFTIRDADQLAERAASKVLAGWGSKAQRLPDL